MNSVKKLSAKRLSVKKPRTVKRLSAKRLSMKKKVSSPKKSSPKKSSLKKSSPKKVTSEYKMRGMGVLLNMYGGASEALEQQVAVKLKELADLKKLLSIERNQERKQQIQKAIDRMQRDIDIAKDKMKHLLIGAAETVSKAASSLGTKTSKAMSKLSSDLLSFRSRRRSPTPPPPAPPVVPEPFSPSFSSPPPAYSSIGGKHKRSGPSKKYERRIEKRFTVSSSSPSKISLSMTGESED